MNETGLIGTDLINRGLRAYEQAIDAGMTPDDAKQYAYTEVPALKSLLAGREWLTHWGNGIKAIRIAHKLTPPSVGRHRPDSVVATPNDNGNSRRRKPLLVISDSGYSKINETVLAALRELCPLAGDTIHFGNMTFWAAILGCTPSAVPNMIQAKSTAAVTAAGYVFEVVNVDYSDFTVRCTQAPPSAADVKRDEEKAAIRREIDKLLARLEAL